MTKDEAIQIVTCVYGACIEDGEMTYADRIIDDLARCFPEIDWSEAKGHRAPGEMNNDIAGV
jgi:hypothetical protein